MAVKVFVAPRPAFPVNSPSSRLTVFAFQVRIELVKKPVALHPIDELVHSLASPLNNVRLQLGLIRQNAAEKDRERIDSADREVQRAQEIAVAVAAATTGLEGTCEVSELFRQIALHWPEYEGPAQKDFVLPVEPSEIRAIVSHFAKGCNSLTTETRVVLQLSEDLTVRVEGAFEEVEIARALRLTHVDSSGHADLALAIARLMATAAGGTLEYLEGAIVLRLPMEEK